MATQPITIRNATVNDVSFLRDMIWEALQSSPQLLNRLGIETLQKNHEQYWTDWIENPDPAFLVINSSGEPLGALTLRPNSNQTPGISWRIGIAVVNQVRRQGIGKKLMEYAICYARDRGMRYLNLFVDPANTAAISFYEHVGFTTVGSNDDLLEMWKDLGARGAGERGSRGAEEQGEK
jgi:GNAT superfamily N-acetyltransferase